MLERVNCERCKYIGLREQHSFLRASSHSLFFCRTAQLVHYFHWNKYYSSCSYGRKVTEWHVLSPARQRMAGDIETQVVLNSNRIRRYCIFYKKSFQGDSCYAEQIYIDKVTDQSCSRFTIFIANDKTGILSVWVLLLMKKSNKKLAVPTDSNRFLPNCLIIETASFFKSSP